MAIQLLESKKKTLLWSAFFGVGVLGLALRVVFPEMGWLGAVFGVLWLASIAGLVFEYKKALSSKSGQYGLNAVFTSVLLLAGLALINFIGVRYPYKADWTRSKVHTLSDQTEKLVKGLTREVNAVYFAKLAQREAARPLLDNLKGLNPKFVVEYVDADKEASRARAAQIKRPETLVLTTKDASGADREQRVENPTEEKVTNALIKLLKERPPTVCAVTGHGEKGMNVSEAMGYESVRKASEAQSYIVKEFHIIRDAKDGKIPDTCDALLVAGPTSAWFDKEIAALKQFLADGGRAVIGFDFNIQGKEYAPELAALLKDWFLKPLNQMIVDPTSRMLGADASIPIVANYSREHAITKDIPATAFSTFAFSRPIETLSGAPTELKITTLGKTTDNSWAIADVSQLRSGRIELDPARNKKGPFPVAVSVDGKLKDSKAKRATRLVVFGSALFATNQFARFGGNLDFFMNSLSWVLEDESLISIRAKEEGAGKVELTQRTGSVIFLVTVLLAPLLIAGAGVTFWLVRRRL